MLGTPDVLEDLLLAGLLDDHLVIGSMNRGGLQGAVFELDDRFTAYDAATIAAHGLDGGKMLTRICLEDAGTADTLEASGAAVSALAAHGLMAMVEPFLTVRRSPTRVENLLDPDSVISSIAIASGLGPPAPTPGSSCRSSTRWSESSTPPPCPVCCSGATPPGDPDETYAHVGCGPDLPVRRRPRRGPCPALPHPTATSPRAVDTAADLVHGGAR